MTPQKTIALVGNPNVGKTTLFNALTGLHQHTGNWAGKTVSIAKGYCKSDRYHYTVIDLPGTYSLVSPTKEETITCDYLSFENIDLAVVVCDANCLERNLSFALQIIELAPRTIICINFMDEAEKKGIAIDFPTLQKKLNIPIIGIIARQKDTIETLLYQIDRAVALPPCQGFTVRYPKILEHSIIKLRKEILLPPNQAWKKRWLCLQLLQQKSPLIPKISTHYKKETFSPSFTQTLTELHHTLHRHNLSPTQIESIIATTYIRSAQQLFSQCVHIKSPAPFTLDSKIDHILTGRFSAYPFMLLLFALIFWLTIIGANYPSSALSTFFAFTQTQLLSLFSYLQFPPILSDILIYGIYQTVSWVVAVMLPPMAIFFPLFTLLEDSGYLPRIAYNLDKPLKKCSACGKQALSICMGFGCNAAAVIGCRIIDSPRERLLAILTNSFIPCNGRFPTLITLLSLFFITAECKLLSSIQATLFFLLLILFALTISLLSTKFLSQTLLKGHPSAYTLELPPYRKPQFFKVLLRSLLDRTVFVLMRAIIVAAPCGLIIWCMANITLGQNTLLQICADTLDPFAQLIGLDGTILLGFILGIPANEIVLPLILMGYMAQNHLTDFTSLSALKEILLLNDWTWLTALCVMLFSILHWPCSTTLLTIKKETNSLKWPLVAFILPTILAISLCFITASVGKLFL